MKIISIQKAINEGLKYYFTGKPCKFGHFSKRYIANRTCYECITSSINKFRIENPQIVKERKHNSYVKNKESVKKKSKAYALANPDKVKKSKKKYYLKNAKTIYGKSVAYKKQNRQQYQYYASQRRAKKLKATPYWADLESIKQFYLNCPEGYEVDHIIPLQGKLVCGLHIPINLQYLTPTENYQKSNSFIPFLAKPQDTNQRIQV